LCDALTTVWDFTSVIFHNCFSDQPNIPKFATACETVRKYTQALQFWAVDDPEDRHPPFDCTVWPHCVLCHLPQLIKEVGSLLVYDNRPLENAHKLTTEYCGQSTHGMVNVQNGKSGYQQALGKDNQRLMYALQDAGLDEVARLGRFTPTPENTCCPHNT